MVQGVITRGLGTPLLVTRGYGTIPSFIAEEIEDFVRRHGGGGGQKRRGRELESIVVWAKMIEYNDKVPSRKIEGFVNVPITGDKVDVTVQRVSRRIREAWEDIKITVKRIK